MEKRENGIQIYETDGVSVENLSVRNFSLNAVYWNGSKGYKASHLTVYNNGDYGVYAFDSTDGVFEKILESLKIVHIVAPKLGMRLTKVKNTEKEFRMSDRQRKKIEKMEIDYNYLTRTKGLRASVAIEKIAKKSNPPLKPSTVETYLTKKKYKVLPDDKNTD